MVALAIADDLGAILVIALFYSNEISWFFLSGGLGIFILLLVLNKVGIKNLLWYIIGGILLWYFFLNSGVHPTIAGVLFAITIPVKPKLDSKYLKERTTHNLAQMEETNFKTKNPLQDMKQRKILKAIKIDTENSRPPLLKLENALIDFNAFFIIPIFAIANAGVKLDVSFFEVVSSSLGLGIIIGLAVGKVAGISLFTWLGQKAGVSAIHSSLKWKHIIGVGMIAGIGFTMSLFITNLAFSSPDMVKVSKISILIASFIAGLIGVLILLLTSQTKENNKNAKILEKTGKGGNMS